MDTSQKILCAWIGNADRDAPVLAATKGPGPIARALDESESALGFRFDEAYLLDDRNDKASEEYIKWLRKRLGNGNTSINPVTVKKGEGWNASDFRAVWQSLRDALDSIRLNPAAERFYLVSSGTQAMGTNWVLASRIRLYQGVLLQSSPENGLERVELPIEMAFDYQTPQTVMQDPAVREARRGKLPGGFVAVGPKMQAIVEKAKRYARLDDEPVLLLGENGTGKEAIAKLIHAESGRRQAPFIAINCGALPGETVESELFGHVKGAFTGAHQDHAGLLEAAAEGTVFLDEIADLPLPQQVKLLRALQEMQIRRVGGTNDLAIRCRFIAATNKSLHEEIANKTFREDLYYRIAGLFIKIPPLRERGEKDLQALIQTKWKDITTKPGIAGQALSEDAIRCLLDHNWPGNVRELARTLARAAADATSATVGAADIEAALDRRTVPFDGDLDDGSPLDIGSGLDLNECLDSIERALLRQALQQANGNQAKAGKLLNLTRQTFGSKLKRHGME